MATVISILRCFFFYVFIVSSKITELCLSLLIILTLFYYNYISAIKRFNVDNHLDAINSIKGLDLSYYII